MGYPNGKTRRQKFALAGQPLAGVSVLGAYEYIVELFFEMNEFRTPSESGLSPIMPETLDRWTAQMGFSLDHWECDTIYKMDRSFRRGHSEHIKSVRKAQSKKKAR